MAAEYSHRRMMHPHAAPAGASPNGGKQALFITLAASASVLFLFFRVFSVDEYFLTVGGLLSLPLLVLTLRGVRFSGGLIAAYLLLVCWPVLVFAGALAIEASLAPEPRDFFRSYVLWCWSVTLIVSALASRRPVLLPNAHILAYIILAVAAVQVLMAGVLGSLAPYEMLEGPLGADIHGGYIRMEAAWNIRAIGLYYEPSMCGLVLGTLAIIDFLQTGRFVRPAIIAVLAVVLVKSLGLVILLAILGAILLSKSLRGAMTVAFAGLIVIALQGDLIEARLNVGASQTQASAVKRTIAPLQTIGYALLHYPAGVPMGMGENLADATGYRQATDENKITNGTYELLIYFGLPGFFGAIWGLIALCSSFISGEREKAAAIGYLFVATVVSGSFLSIECGLLISYFVATCMAAARRRAGTALPARIPPRRPPRGVAAPPPWPRRSRRSPS